MAEAAITLLSYNGEAEIAREKGTAHDREAEVSRSYINLCTVEVRDLTLQKRWKGSLTACFEAVVPAIRRTC